MLKAVAGGTGVGQVGQWPAHFLSSFFFFFFFLLVTTEVGHVGGHVLNVKVEKI